MLLKPDVPYSLKAMSLLLTKGCQKYSKIVRLPDNISTVATIPGKINIGLSSSVGKSPVILTSIE